jgi:hypothetical protein
MLMCSDFIIVCRRRLSLSPLATALTKHTRTEERQMQGVAASIADRLRCRESQPEADATRCAFQGAGT